jgi:hypothetical protein
LPPEIDPITQPRKLLTWVIGAGVVALLLVAGLDALRSDGGLPTRSASVVSQVSSAVETVEVDLLEWNSSGQLGTATLELHHDRTLKVTIELGGGSEEPQPAYIQAGRCSARFRGSDIGTTDEFTTLNDVVNGTSTSELRLPFNPDSPSERNQVIAVHKSAAKIETRVACGNIPDISLP